MLVYWTVADSAEFCCHRLDEYEQALRRLLARGEKLSPDRNLCSTGDLEILLETMAISEKCLMFEAFAKNDSQDTPPSLSTVDRCFLRYAPT